MNIRSFTICICVFTPILCVCLGIGFYVGWQYYLVKDGETFNMFLTTMIFLYPYILLITTFIYRLGRTEIKEDEEKHTKEYPRF